MKESKTLLQAKSACLKKAKTLETTPSNLDTEELNQLILENLCYDILSHSNIANALNKRSTQTFEEKFASFQSNLRKLAQEWRNDCSDMSMLKYLSCMKKLRVKKTNEYFDEWASLKGNKEFATQKEIFLKRSLQKSLIQDRKIASEEQL